MGKEQITTTEKKMSLAEVCRLIRSRKPRCPMTDQTQRVFENAMTSLDGANAAVDKLIRELAESRADCTRLREEIQEMRQLFDLQWKADMRGIEMWRAEKPGRELTQPDQAHLSCWLLNIFDHIREEAASAVEDLESANPVKRLASHLAISMIASANAIPLGGGRWTFIKESSRPALAASQPKAGAK